METLPGVEGARSPHLAIARHLYMHTKKSIKDLDHVWKLLNSLLKEQSDSLRRLVKLRKRMSERLWTEP